MVISICATAWKGGIVEQWSKPNNLRLWIKGFEINFDDFSMHVLMDPNYFQEGETKTQYSIIPTFQL